MTTNNNNSEIDNESENGLICFTNCFLLTDDGQLKQGDLWVDVARGVILDAQRTFYLRKDRPRPENVIDLGGNILAPGLIDAQINGAYGFDFSEYDGDDEKYLAGLDMVARRIVETGVTSLLPTIITQERDLYPRLLELLRPRTPAAPHLGATLLGWHAEGPFLTPDKRGAHAFPLLQPSLLGGLPTLENIYSPRALAHAEDWSLSNPPGLPGVRMITLAPELPGALAALRALVRTRGVQVSIGHSLASADTAARAVRRGARMVTHLFNAMPQLHHRDPGIIGLLGASPASLVSAPKNKSANASGMGHAKSGSTATEVLSPVEATSFADLQQHGQQQEHGETEKNGTGIVNVAPVSEALAESTTPPETPIFSASTQPTIPPPVVLPPTTTTTTPPTSQPEETDIDIDDHLPISSNRPFYGLISDGVHIHPNSIRLAYTAHPSGCVLITDALKLLSPSLPDGIYPWRPHQKQNKNLIKKGSKLYVEETYHEVKVTVKGSDGSEEMTTVGTGTLAGSVVPLDECVRNFRRFTGVGVGEALRCATGNPARALGGVVERRKGTLRAGADADLVVVKKAGAGGLVGGVGNVGAGAGKDGGIGEEELEEGTVLQTWVRGRKVWARPREGEGL